MFSSNSKVSLDIEIKRSSLKILENKIIKMTDRFFFYNDLCKFEKYLCDVFSF